MLSLDSTAQAAFFWASFIGIAFSGIIAWQQGGGEWDWIYLQDWLVATAAAYPLSAAIVTPTMEVMPALTYGFIMGAMIKGGSSGLRKVTQGKQTAEKQFWRAGRKILQNSGERILNEKMDEIVRNAR